MAVLSNKSIRGRIGGSLTHTLLLVALLLGFLVAQQLFVIPGSSPLRQALHNSLHTPWFFVVTIILCLIFRRLTLLRRSVVVGLLALLIAIGTESLQSLSPERSASLGDLQRNLVGAAFALLVSGLVLLPGNTRPSLARVLTATILVLMAAIFSFGPVVGVYTQQRERIAMFPKLIDLRDSRVTNYVRVSKRSQLEVVQSDKARRESSGPDELKVRFGDSEYPTLYIKHLGQHWHAYEQLVFELLVEGEESLPLVAAVQYEGSHAPNSRYNFVAPPGVNRVEVPRNRLVPDDATGIKIKDLLLYTTRDNAGRSIFVRAIYLR